MAVPSQAGHNQLGKLPDGIPIYLNRVRRDQADLVFGYGNGAFEKDYKGSWPILWRARGYQAVRRYEARRVMGRLGPLLSQLRRTPRTPTG